MHSHHAIDYVELTVTDTDAARAFYSQAFGWQLNDYGPEYTGIQGEQEEQGGLRLDTTARPPLVILYSDDLDKSVDSVTQAGGTITQPPYEFPGGRRFHFADPAGNELAVWATS